MKFETVFNPAEANIAPVDRGLHDFNLARLGQAVIAGYERVLVTARGEDGELIGGVHGEMFWDWLHIQTLWVAEAYRGTGIGSRLMRQIEEAARSKGYSGSHTETTDFQALDFYLKNGYEVFGELEGKPAGHSWYFLKKALTGDGEVGGRALS